MTQIKTVFEYWLSAYHLLADRIYIFSWRSFMALGYVLKTIHSAYKHLLRKYLELGFGLQKSKLKVQKTIAVMRGLQKSVQDALGGDRKSVWCLAPGGQGGFMQNVALQQGLQQQHEVRVQDIESDTKAAVRLLRLGSDSTVNHLCNFDMCLSLSFALCKMQWLHHLCHRVIVKIKW